MLAAQVPVCELFPAAPQSVELSWGKHSIVQLSDIVQLSTGACWEQGVTLGVSHTVGSARALGACACQLRSKEPYPQIQILLPALSLLWEVRTVFACYPSENLCSDFSAFFYLLLPLKTALPQVWSPSLEMSHLSLFFCKLQDGFGLRCKCHAGRAEWAPSAQGHNVSHTVLLVWQIKNQSEKCCTDAAVWDSAAKII